MDNLGDQVGQYWAPIAQQLQTGFETVNAAQGLAIALLAAILMRKWLQLPMASLLAALAHAIIDWAVPIVAGKAALKLPPLVELGYWQGLLGLFAGYLVIVAVFHAAKRGIMGLARRAAPSIGRTPSAAAPTAGASAPTSGPSSGRPAAPPPSTSTGKHK